MNWAVYWQDHLGTDINCLFFKTREEAEAKVNSLMAEQDKLSEDHERNIDLDITLLQVRGEVRPQSPDSHLKLEPRGEA